MSDTTTAPGFGRQTVALVRTLVTNAMLVLVPVAAYYFAVIEREDRFRTEQAFDALREIREGMASYVERVDAMLATSAQVLFPEPQRRSDPGHPLMKTLARDLHLDSARIADGGLCSRADDPLQPLDLWFVSDRAADSGLRLARCMLLNGAPARVEVQAAPGVLLDSPRAVRRFAQVLLVGEAGQVLAAMVPQERHQSASLQEPVRAVLPPASLAALLKAVPKQIDAGAKAPEAGPVDEGLARIVAGEIAGQSYRVYIAPLRPPFPIYDRDPCAARGAGATAAAGCDGARLAGPRIGTVYLVGLVPESRFDDAAQALGLAGSWYLLAAVLVCATAWPLLRVLLLAPNQALSRRLLAATMIGCMILCGMVTLLVESVIEQRHLLRVRDSEADLYASRLAEAAQSEVRRSFAELIPYRDWYAGVGATAQPGQAPPVLLACEGAALAQQKRAGAGEFGDRSCSPAPGTDRYCRIRLPSAADGSAGWSALSQVIATGDDGVIRDAPMLSPFGCQPRAASIPVDKRPYFQQLRDRHGWPVAPLLVPDEVQAGWPERFVAQRLFAKTDASRGLELAVPRSEASANGFAGIVGGLSPVYPLSAALRPPFLSFAIVDDASGVVVFHTDDEASLRENFFVETGREPVLLAAVADRQPARVAGYYRGEAEHFLTRPVPGLPWTVVVFHAVDSTVAPAVNAAFVALLQLAALLVAVGLALGAMLVGMRLVRLGPAAWARTPWQWIWPQWRLRDRYPWLVLILIVLVAVNILAIGLVQPRRFDLGWGLLATLLVVAAWLAFQWLFAPEGLPVRGSEVPPRGLRERWKRSPLRALPAPFGNAVDTVAEFRFWYVGSLVFGLILVAAVPASALYFGAVDTLREGELRVAMRDTADSFTERVERIARDLSRQAGASGEGSSVRPRPSVIARAERAVGFACDPHGHYIWAPDRALDQPHRACVAAPGDVDAADGTTAPEAPPWRQFTIDRLAPVLPRLQAVSRALAPASAGAATSYRLDGDQGRLSYRVAGRHETIEIEASLRTVLLKARGASSKAFELVVAAALALAGLGLIAYVGTLLSRRTLGVDAPPAPRAPLLAGASFEALLEPRPRAALQLCGAAQPPWRWWYIGFPAGADVPDFAWLEQQLKSLDDHRVISLADAALAPGSLTHGEPLMLLHFDRAVLDPARRRIVLEALESRARLPVHTLLCAMSPPWARLCEPASFPDREGLPDAEEALRWIDLRHRYAVHHWHEATPPVAVPDWLRFRAAPTKVAPPDERPQPGLRDRALRERLVDEVIALGELLGRTPRSLPAVEVLARRGKLRDVGDLIELLIDEVQGDFHRAWQFCTTAERLALYQLANNRIPNPRNRRVLDDLLIRRLVILAPEARIACDSFRRFVLSAEPAERFAEWTGLERGGPWDSVRAPFLILLTLLLAWFAFAAGDVFNTVAAVLAGTVGLLANASKVLGFARGVGGDK